MNFDTKKIIDDMTDVKSEYEFALARGSGIASTKERMKNVGFNYFDQLLDIAKQNIALKEQIEVLNVALEDSDRELAELKAKAKSTKKKNTAETE